MNRAFSVIHLSDLHFGRIHPEILRELESFIEQRKKEIQLVILTGDLTQRAKEKEFLAAREFFSKLNSPLFIVPGNHDVPLYNLFLRFTDPYKKFLKFLGPFAQNFYQDENLAVYGLWTTNHFTTSSGKLLEKNLNEMEEKFRSVSAHKVKIVAGHHPLTSLQYPGSKRDLDRLTKLEPHFMLWGHVHQSGIRSVFQDRTFPLSLAAGTSASTRTRGEANSFNYLTFEGNEVKIEIFTHSKLLKNFEVTDERKFSLP